MKNFKELKTIEEVQRELPEGTKVRCKIDNTNIEDAEIHYDNSKMFILQNKMDGSMCDTTKDHKYSWLTFHNECWGDSDVEDLEVVGFQSAKQKTTPVALTKEELLTPTINIAINPKTAEENKLLTEWYISKNKHSLNGDMPSDKFWSGIYGDGCFNHTAWMNNEGTYCTEYFYKESGFKIITVQEFFKILFN